MPFIGNQPALSYTSFAKQDFTTSATTSYTLDHPVTNENELALFINFVRQEPTTAYTASGTSLTLTSATSASDDMYCVFLGKAVQTVNPPNSSVGSSQVSADLITGQTALGATPADTDELLISDAGTLKRVDYSYLKSANTPAFHVKRTSSQSISTTTNTKVQFDSEDFDTDNCFDNSTNYRFTPGVAGKYYLYAGVRPSQSDDFDESQVYIRKNGSDVALGTKRNTYSDTVHCYTTVVSDSDDYFEVFYYHTRGSTLNISGNSSASYTYFGGYKIIE